MSLMDSNFRWPEFRDFAICAGMDSTLFFTETTAQKERDLKGLEVCRKCFVREDCLEHAIKNREKYGIWGGRTSSQRDRIRRLRRKLEREASSSRSSP